MAPVAEQVRRKARASVQRKRKPIATLATRPGTRLVGLSRRLAMSQRGTSDREHQNFSRSISPAFLETKEVGHCVNTVFATSQVAVRAVTARERDRGPAPVVAGVQAP